VTGRSGAVSFWLSTAGDLTPRPPLGGSTDADVAILGAGYTGLWTAWYLLRQEPGLRVAICEQEVAGFGASGRNGAWCVANLGVSPGELARRYGRDAARRTTFALRAAVDEIGGVCAAEGLDAGYRKDGLLRIARGAHELPALRAGWDERDGLGLAEGCALLDAGELAGRVRVADARGAMFDPHCATVHPGRLVRGLAGLVERAGATIYEGTRVTGIDAGPRPALRTCRGTVRAGTVVLAGEAYLARQSRLHRHVLPLYSLVVLTEPLPDARWSAIGWARGECLSSHRYTVDYLSRTADGRILFGGRGAPYHYGSRVRPEHDRHAGTHAHLRDALFDWFPPLRGIGFTHAWGGPLAMPRDWLPTVAHNPRTGLAAAFGYTGQGVATANLAGRILAARITGGTSEFDDLPFVGHRPRRWEPEPVRWVAVRLMQRAAARLDARARRTGRAPTGRSLPERLLRH
jgi:glycine/D-amino acid oxidase-like deaminating enzyme